MIVLRWVGLASAVMTVVLVTAVGVMTAVAPQYGEDWALTYATTNGSQSFWRVHLLDVGRDVSFTIVHAEMASPVRPVLSPDERYVVLEGDRLVLLDLWEDRRYQMQQGGANVIWTPDSTRFAYLNEGEVYVTQIGDNGPIEILVSLGISLPDYLAGWSPDGERLAYIHRDTLRMLDTTTGDVTILLDNDDVNFRFVDWSPGGEYLLVSYNYERMMGQYDLMLLPTDGTEPTLLYDTTDRVIGLKWSPDGERALILEQLGNVRQMRILSLLPEVGRISGELVLPLDANHFQWVPDSRRILYINQRDRDIYIVDVVGSNLRRLTNNNNRNVLLK